MRRLAWIDISGNHVQDNLEDLNREGFKRFGITDESQIVSVQHQTVKIGDDLKSVVYVFYWAND